MSLTSSHALDVKQLRKRPHLVFLNRSYWPDTEATGQLLTELTTDLSRTFDVTVIAGHPNHVDESANPDETTTTEHAGVTVHRVWHSKFSKFSTLGRLVNLVTFTFSAWYTAHRLKRRPDLLVIQTDPFLLPLIGSKLQRRFGNCPLVCYLQDLYPDIAVAVGKAREGRLTRALRKWLFKSYNNAQSVVVLSRDMKARCQQHGVQVDKIEVIANWADTDKIQPIKTNNTFREVHNLGSQFVVMYSGNMGLAHDLDTLIDAADLLRDRTNIVWLFIGDGAQREALVRRVAELELTNVRFLPYQPRSTLAQSLSAADVHLVSVLPGAAACVMPSKLYGILASGTPTVAVVEPETELSDLLTEHTVGFTCSPGDSNSLAERICQLANDSHLRQSSGIAARELSLSQFSRITQVARLDRLFSRLVGSAATASSLELDDRTVLTGASPTLDANTCHLSPAVSEFVN